jgi:hypothetical protein
MLLILVLSTATTADLMLTIEPPTISLNSKSVSTQMKTTEIALNMARQVQAKIFGQRQHFRGQVASCQLPATVQHSTGHQHEE